MDLFEKSKDSGLGLSFLEADDVDEYAQLIGLKFDKIIKEFNLGDKLHPLMENVIFLLEQTNLMVKERDEYQSNINNLENELNQYKWECKENKLEKLRCQNEFEQIEEAYRKENTELLNLISKLNEDNLRLRNLLDKENINKEVEKEFEKNVNGVEDCTQKLLVNEKRKVQNLQKELDLKNEKNDQLEKQIDQDNKKLEILNKQIQKLKEDNFILKQQNDFKDAEFDNYFELVDELKNQLTITIQDHLDEQQLNSTILSTISKSDDDDLYKDDSICKQNNHLEQLQLIQKLVETLSVAHENLNRIDTMKFDKFEFQKKLNEKLDKLDQEQQQQKKRLHSANNTPIDSPQHLSLESNLSFNNNRSPKLIEQPQTKFSLLEIRNIIFERNSLQSQIKYLEKQIVSSKLLNKKDQLDDKFNIDKLNESSKNNIDDFFPVQGPLPKEPDDKLYPNKKNNSLFSRYFPLYNKFKILNNK